MEKGGPIFCIIGDGASVDHTIIVSSDEEGDVFPLPPENREARLYTYYDPDHPPLSVDALESNQGMERLWKHVEELRSNARVDPTHLKLKELIRDREACIVTQNVDGLIKKVISGVIELHGHLDSATCLSCKKQWSMPPLAVPAKVETPRSQKLLNERRVRRTSFSEDWDIQKVERLLNHHCGECGAWLRPDMVLIGESINPKHGFDIFSWIKKHHPVECYVIGTTLQFSYLRQMIMSCRKVGAKVIHVNPDPEYPWHRLREKTIVRDSVAVMTFVKRKKEDEIRTTL